MFYIQVAAVVLLTLLLLLMAALMRPIARSGQQTADRPWASYSADQVLVLLGMVRRPGCQIRRLTASQRFSRGQIRLKMLIAAVWVQAPTAAEAAMHRKTRQGASAELQRSGWGASQASREVRGVVDANTSAGTPVRG